MSRQKLEQVLEYLINEEEEKARDLLHTVFVEKARAIHETLIEDEDEDIEEALEDDKDEDEVDESAKSKWEDEIRQDDDVIETHRDEIAQEEDFGEDEDGEDEISDVEAEDDLDDMEIGGDDAVEPEGDAEEAIPAKLDDLEAAVEELKAEFDKLMGGEEEAPMDDEMGDAEIGMGDEMDMVAPEEEAIRYESKEDDEENVDEAKDDDDAEELDEAASLSAVGAAKMGDDGDAGAKSTITGGNVKRSDHGVKAVEFAKGDEKGRSADKPAEGMTTNQDAKLSAGPKAESGDKSDKGAKSLVKDMR